MYRDRLGNFSLDYLFAGTRLWSQFLIDQMGILGLSIALLYIVVFFRPSRLHFITVWLALTYSMFAIIYYSPDSYVYLILPLFAFAIWIGQGCEYVLEKLPSKTTFLRPLLLTGSIVFVIARAFWAIPVMDLSNNHTAEEYAQTVLDTLPEQAFIVTQGDESTFALWYFHYVNDLRPDVAIISNGLSELPWYRDVLTNTYPDLNLSESLSVQTLVEFNPLRPVCMLGTDLQPQFECYSN